MPAAKIQATAGYWLVQAARAHRERVQAGLAGLGLHAGQDLVLVQLWAEDGLTQSQLAERLGVEPPTVTKMLHRMARAGLVERRRDPADARVSRVYLTGRGRALAEPVLQVWQGVEGQLAAGLSPLERELLRRLLTAVYRNMA